MCNGGNDAESPDTQTSGMREREEQSWGRAEYQIITTVLVEGTYVSGQTHTPEVTGKGAVTPIERRVLAVSRKCPIKSVISEGKNQSKSVLEVTV